ALAFDNLIAAGIEDDCRGPAILLIPIRQIRARILIYLDSNVARAEKPDHLGIAVGDVLHHVTPVAPDCTQIEKNKSVFRPRSLKDLLGPRLPVDGLAPSRWPGKQNASRKNGEKP